MANRYDSLKLENQICFPLYACAKGTAQRYKEFLDPLDLTYTQYLTMLVLWERGRQNVKELGEALLLDSGTLTPVLKKLETKGYVKRERNPQDERVLYVSLTRQGEQLKDRAISVPEAMRRGYPLNEEETRQLYTLLYKLMGRTLPQ